MDRKIFIEKLKDKISKLPDNKIQEVNDFADFLLSKIDDHITVEGIQKMMNDSKAYDFLKEDDDLYTIKDLKEKYT